MGSREGVVAVSAYMSGTGGTFINKYRIQLLEPSHVVCSENTVNQRSKTHILPYFILGWSTIMKADTHNFSIMKYICNLQKLYIIKKFIVIHLIITIWYI